MLTEKLLLTFTYEATPAWL